MSLSIKTGFGLPGTIVSLVAAGGLAIAGLTGAIDESSNPKPAVAPAPTTIDVDFCQQSTAHDNGVIVTDKGQRNIYRLQRSFDTVEWVDSPPADLGLGVNTTALLNGKAVEVTSAFVDCVRSLFPPKTSSLIPAQSSDYFAGYTALNIGEHDLWQSGAWPWHYTDRCNGVSILPSVALAFEETSQRYGVYFYYDSGQNNSSVCASELVAHCGVEWAIACVGADYPYYPKNCDAYYNGAAMVTWWTEISRTAVVKHELQHCQTTRAEGYLPGGICVASDTIMGCGQNSPKDYSQHDDNAYYEAQIPNAIQGTAITFNPLVLWWGSPDAQDTGVSSCTRVAVLKQILGTPSTRGFTGIYGSCAAGIQGIGVPFEKCIEYFINPENAESITWGKNVVRVGNTACN